MCGVMFNQINVKILCCNHISAQRGAWFNVSDTTQQFLVTMDNYMYKFKSCDNVCNSSSGSLAPFLPVVILSVLETIQEEFHGCWVQDNGKCILLFRDRHSHKVSFSSPNDCAGEGHCVCWKGTRDSHQPTSVPQQVQNSSQATLRACSTAQDQTSTTSATVKPTTATPSTSIQQATTVVSAPSDNETNPFTSMPKEALNNWTMYDLQELYINTNKTSHDNASRFCHDELNSTLVTVLNPLEYLRLLKTMGLKTGIFWIGK